MIPTQVITSHPSFGMTPTQVITDHPSFGMIPTQVITSHPSFGMTPTQVITSLPSFGMTPTQVITDHPSFGMTWLRSLRTIRLLVWHRLGSLRTIILLVWHWLRSLWIILFFWYDTNSDHYRHFRVTEPRCTALVYPHRNSLVNRFRCFFQSFLAGLGLLLDRYVMSCRLKSMHWFDNFEEEFWVRFSTKGKSGFCALLHQENVTKIHHGQSLECWSMLLDLQNVWKL